MDRVSVATACSDLMMQNDLWSSREDGLLRKYYPDFNALKQTLSGRSIRAIRGRCRKLRIQTHRKKPWTSEEILRLRRIYAKASKGELLDKFPDRTLPAILSQGVYRGLSRARRQRLPSGDELVDGICARARLLGYSLQDLDEIAGSKGYFQNAYMFKARPNMRHVQPVIRELGGELIIKWKDH